MGELAVVSEIDGRVIQNSESTSVLSQLREAFNRLVQDEGEALPF